MNVFAYGALLDEDVQRAVIGRTPSWKPGFLRDYTIAHCADGFFGLQKEPGERVVGAILELSDPELARVEHYEGRRARAWLLPIIGPAKRVVASRTYVRFADGDPVGETNAVAAMPISDVLADAQAAFATVEEPLRARVLDAVRASEDDGLTCHEIAQQFPEVDSDTLATVGRELVASVQLVPTGQKRDNAPVYVLAAQTRD